MPRIFLGAGLLLFSSVLLASAEEPSTIGSKCKRLERSDAGDTVWINFGTKGEVVFCAELHDSFHRKQWIATLSGGASSTLSTEAMAISFIEKQPFTPKNPK